MRLKDIAENLKFEKCDVTISEILLRLKSTQT